MKNRILAILIAVIVLLAAAIPAGAITDGELDGDGHPMVGLMVADAWDCRENDEGDVICDYYPLWRCSGTLISPTLFITAGHCTEPPAERATVWFDTDLHLETGELDPYYGYPYGGPTSIDGDVYTHPDFDSAAFFLYDVGMVVLDEPVYLDEYATLPSVDQLDGLKSGKKGATFTSVGYGLQAAYPEAAAWKEEYFKTRMVATPFLLQIDKPGFTSYFSMLLSNNHVTGGTCYGDSGGPNFLGDSLTIAGITSFGINPRCAGTGGVYRLDQQVALDWIYADFGHLLP